MPIPKSLARVLRGAFCENLLSRWHRFQATKAYDVLVCAPLFCWYGVSAGQLVSGLAAKLQNSDIREIDLTLAVWVLVQTAGIAMILLSLAFVLARRPARAKSKGALPRISAIAGSYLNLAIVWLPPVPAGLGVSLLSLVLMLGGLSFSVFALFHLGRSFSLMAEARRLVVDGPYARIRHPLYLGEAISLFGFALQYLSPLALLILATQFAFQVHRMKNEERVLATLFPEYETYRLRTARLVPGIY